MEDFEEPEDLSHYVDVETAKKHFARFEKELEEFFSPEEIAKADEFVRRAMKERYK